MKIGFLEWIDTDRLLGVADSIVKDVFRKRAWESKPGESVRGDVSRVRTLRGPRYIFLAITDPYRVYMVVLQFVVGEKSPPCEVEVIIRSPEVYREEKTIYEIKWRGKRFTLKPKEKNGKPIQPK